VIKRQDGNIKVEEATLDHLYTTINDLQHWVDESPMSDHHILSCLIDSWKPKARKMIRRDWRGYSAESIHHFVNTYVGKKALTKLRQSTCVSACPDEILESINEFLLLFTNQVAPFRVTHTRQPQDIIDSGCTALKKKRDRALKKFYKTRNPEDHYLARILTKQLKSRLKKTMNNKLQKKACTKNQKDFWNVISEISGKKVQEETMELEIDGSIVTDPKKLSETMADFFSNKIKKLCSSTGLMLPITSPPRNNASHAFTKEELHQILKTTKRKKSSGIDGLPMNIVADAAAVLMDDYLKLFNLCLNRIPKLWKIALVRPLHKSGSKTDPANFRPISNLCSLEKIFERLLLKELSVLSDGSHQHGFKAHHSTTTAMLSLQEVIASRLDEKMNVVVYSLDLSAAFDMLRVDIFYELLKDEIPCWLMSTIVDFLSERKCIVNVEEASSAIRDVPLGCVQGSVLGPRLFNLYTSKIPECFPHEIEIISYADDSYVVVYDKEEKTLVKKLEECISAHTRALLSLGMIVNTKKTEAVRFGKNLPAISFDSLGEVIETKTEMKVLGVIFDQQMDWTSHVNKAVKKVNRLTAGLKFLRKRLSKQQFLNAVTSQYYGLLYYGCQVWLGQHTRSSNI